MSPHLTFPAVSLRHVFRRVAGEVRGAFRSSAIRLDPDAVDASLLRDIGLRTGRFTLPRDPYRD